MYITDDNDTCPKCGCHYVIADNPPRKERHKLYGAGYALCKCPKCDEKLVLKIELQS